MQNEKKKPWEALRERKQFEKRRFVAAFLKGMLVLGIVGYLTYIGKVKPKEFRPPIFEDLVLWILPGEERLSALIVLPHDGIDTNGFMQGERIFLNPETALEKLDSNHIRYRQGDLYLAGNSRPEVLSRLCNALDSGFHMYLSLPDSVPQCPSAMPWPVSEAPLTTDDTVKTWFKRVGRDFWLRLDYAGQSLVLMQGPWAMDGIDSLQLVVYLDARDSLPELPSRLVLSPNQAFQEGKFQQDLISSSPQQVISLRLNPRGILYAKKLILEKPVLP